MIVSATDRCRHSQGDDISATNLASSIRSELAIVLTHCPNHYTLIIINLTQTAGLKIAPLFLQSLVKHYYGKVVKDPNSSRASLRDEELLYDQVFFVIKQLMQDATTHTVEEFQSFMKARGASLPWVNVVRALVPPSLCELAAAHLIKACGGEEVMKRTLGGTKWWQVRDTQGVEAEWVTAEKARESPRQYRSHRRKGATETERPSLRVFLSDEDDDSEGVHTDRRPEMDDAPCLLYIHGGGYYFGTAEGGRGTLERYAQKIQGRVFAVNYRLAPQYPFPCAIQDVLAAYLYLIQPPAGASHRPVNPSKVVIGGDSSGGGLALALLQVIRDAGLPMPAGGVLVSPWCDLTHSFHSIMTNTETDILPETGLSLHKPSLLWPPPSEEMTSEVHARLRMFANDSLHSCDGCEGAAASSSTCRIRAPRASKDGNQLTAPQFQFYAENGLLRHPLVRPCFGLPRWAPPALLYRGNGEVLRDEIVLHVAHRAAHPEKFPVSEEVKTSRTKIRPTPVHLQIYDDAAHILPNLFPFTTPAKYCARAITSFIRQVTHAPPKTVLTLPQLATTRSASSGDSGSDGPSLEIAGERSRIVASLSQATIRLRGRSAQIFRFGNEDVSVIGPSSRSSSLDDGECSEDNASQPKEPAVVFAGNETVYERWSGDYMPMIRERVSTQGIIRPLEREEDLPAFKLSPQLVGVIPESVLERYMAAKQAADQKFRYSAGGATSNVRVRTSRSVRPGCGDVFAPAVPVLVASMGECGGLRGRWTRTSILRRAALSSAGHGGGIAVRRAADRRWLLEYRTVAGGGGPEPRAWARGRALLQRTSNDAGVSMSKAEVVRSVEVC
ncbi:Alpha/Beta hydrolase protein [Lactarius quietus]|nr:Alpha/Beta hydrolase protein [Lactarius quietus]